MTLRISLLRLLCLCLSLGLLSGCPSSAKPKPDDAKAALVAPPGALRWDVTARQLPARSPAVLTLRGSDLLHGIDQLYDWLVSDAEMFGASGEQIVQSLANIYDGFRSEWSFDPLTTRGWASQGLDLKRPIYVGLYPLQTKDEQSLRQVEAQLRQAFEINGDEDLQETLLRWSRGAPQGLYAKLAASSVEGGSPFALRLILPMEDEAVILGRLDRLAEQFKLRAALSDSGRALRRIFFEPDVGGQIIAISVSGKDAIIDIFPSLMPRVEPGQPVIEVVRAAVLEQLSLAKAGAPFAPMPMGRTGVSLSMDQHGLSQRVRREAYARALKEASLAASDRRDAELLRHLKDASHAILTWSPGTPGLSGISYDLLLSEQERLAGLRVSFFGARALKLPQAQPRQVSLELSQRALGFGVDGALLFGAAWQGWLGVARATALRDVLTYERSEERGEDIKDLGTLTYMMSVWRNIALLPINASALVRTMAPLEFLPLYAMRERIARVEMATPGLDLSGFLAKPQVVTLITLQPGLSDKEQDGVVASLMQTLNDIDSSSEATAPPEDPEIEPKDDATPKPAPTPTPASAQPVPAIKTEVYEDLKLAPTHPLKAGRYFYKRASDAQAQGWLVLGFNMGVEELGQEVARIQKSPNLKPSDALYWRVEPVGLVKLLSTYTPPQLASLDLNVLAQRLGPLILSYKPVTEEGVQVIHATVELGRPPSLD